MSRKIKENEKLREEIEQIKRVSSQGWRKFPDIRLKQQRQSWFPRRIETEAKREAAVKLAQIESDLHNEADTKAKNIISLAIQRLASDQVSETTVSVVPLPSDEMKGRIIGREGRNIHRDRDSYGSRFDHRRYAGSHYAFLLRSDSQRNRTDRVGKADLRWTNPSVENRRNGRKGTPRGGTFHQAGWGKSGIRYRGQRTASRPCAVPWQIEIPHELRSKRTCPFG